MVFMEANVPHVNQSVYNEIVPFSHSNKSGQQPHYEVNGAVIPVRSEAKCLGYWWRNDVLPSNSVSENIGKAPDVPFFLHGSIGAFQGDLNPLSKDLIETCTLPVLMSGYEN